MNKKSIVVAMVLLGGIGFVLWSQYRLRQELHDSRELLKQLYQSKKASSPETTKQEVLDVDINAGDAFIGRTLTKGAPLPEWLTATVLSEAAGLEYMNVVLNPLLTDLYFTYPLEPLRQQFRQVVDDPLIDTKASFAGTSWEEVQNLPLATVVKTEPPHTFAIQYFVQQFRNKMFELASRCASDEVARREFEDLFLAVTLHEYYHATQQAEWLGELSFDELVTLESECWAYTCREVIIPMQQAGRAQYIAWCMPKGVIAAYHDLDGNTDDQRWRHAVAEAMQ